MNTRNKFRPFWRLLNIAVIIFLCFNYSVSFAQENLALGQWRIHLPFNRINSVTEGNGKIYCAATDGIFIYSKDDGSISRLTRLEGLSDFDVAHISYFQSQHLLMITYQNSNIDLFYDDNSIYNIKDIFNANIIGNKTINHIDFKGRYAYLSCGFGIVEVDLERREIKDTWYIGANGNSIPVYGIVFYNNEVFAATEQGIYRADANDPHIFLYTAWSKDTTLPAPNKRYNHIALWGSKLVANCDSTTSQNRLMVYDNTSWTFFNSSPDNAVFRMENHNDILTVATYCCVAAYDVNQNIVHNINSWDFNNANPLDGLVDQSNIFWIADGNNGLVKNPAQGDYTFIYPNGPGSPNAYAMAGRDGRIWVAAGMIEGAGFFNRYTGEGGYLFKENQWKSFNKRTDHGLDTTTFTDFVAVAIDPVNPDHAYFGSWGRGLFELSDNGVQHSYSPSNSPIQAIPVPNYYHVEVGGLAFDSNRNLWIVNSAVSQPVIKRKPDGTWQTFSPSVLLNTIPQMLMCDSRDRKWILLPWGGGLVVFDEVNTFSHTPDEVNDPHARKFGIAEGKGKLPSLNVQCIAEDKDGQIWIGTEKGVAVLYSPDNVYSGNFDFAQILLQQDGNWQYLLETEMVTAIAVDGANYKWFGTEASGVYWMLPDGTTQLAHYTAENSPLLSNKIFSITIDNKSGEVFFGTDRGIVSMKSPVVEGGDDFENVYVYPNPVRPGYSGSIAIRGLVANSNIKITDIGGNIVFETLSLGGQAIWDGKNFKGERTQSGVYIVYCSNDDGTKTAVTKLLLMH
jgi:hypothetical protein